MGIGDPYFLEYLEDIFNNYELPLEYEKLEKIIKDEHVKLLGIEGSFKYKPSGFPSFSQRDSIDFLNNKEEVDILVSHDTRFNSDRERDPAHQGLFGITYYLFKNRVPYHIHGHIHEPYKSTMINGTEEISVFNYEFIEL